MMLRRRAANEKKENELQKLELVGTLAASTAHEIKNPLTGIKGLVQLLSEQYTTEKDQYYFSVINKEINRINEIVSEFLILGKPTVQRTEKIDIREIIRELEPLIEYEVNINRLNSTFLLPEEPVYVKGTKDQIKQVLLNITKNGIESMEKGGHLTVQLTIKENLAQLVVIDTGIGIPKRDLKKIFKPFFTSKETGTGLGLVICNRIIQTFGGEISISSKVDKGTKVLITLPLYQ
jgi:two-component system, sporulation sensor kinase D